MFTHCPIKRKELTRIDSNSGRRYVTPEGNSYSSVTSWLSRSSDNTWLTEWKARVGEEQARKISTRASIRGTLLHNNAESYLRNDLVEVADMGLLERDLFVPLSKHLSKHVDNIRAIELSVYSDTLKLAGTLDLCAEYDGKLSIIDFKTSKEKKKLEHISDYFIQCSLYSYMIQELYNIKIDQLVVLIGVDFQSTTQTFIQSRKDWDDILFSRIKQHPPS